MATGNAAILISRKRQRKSAAVAAHVLVDGSSRAKLWRGQAQRIDVPAGTHLVTVAGWGTRSAELEVTVAAGETVRLEVRPTIGWWRGGWWIENATPSSRTSPAAVPTTWRVSELSRQEVATSDETRQIDNWLGVSPVVRRFKISREWVRAIMVDAEHATTRSIGAGFNLRVIDIKGQTENALRDHYRASVEERQVFEEEVTITTAPRTRSRVVFTWKEIRQRGFVELIHTSDSVVQVPFELVVGLSFDQQQIDEAQSAG